MSTEERYYLVFDFETTGLPLNQWDHFEPYETVRKWNDGNPIMERVEKKDENGNIYYVKKTIPIGPSNPEHWPYAVQLCYILYDKKEQRIAKCMNEIIRLPEGIKIDPKSELIHKISLEITQGKTKRFTLANGEVSYTYHPMMEDILHEFMEDFKKADKIIAHNLRFDKSILLAELTRCKHIDPIFEEYIQQVYFSKKDYCTGIYGKNVCKIEAIGSKGTKYYKMPKLKELYQTLFGYFPLESKLHDAFMDVMICFRSFYKMRFSQDICNEPTVPLFLLDVYNDISPLKNRIYRLNDLQTIEEIKMPRKSQRLLLKIKVNYFEKKTRRNKIKS